MMAGIWKVMIGTPKESIELNRQNNRGTQGNRAAQKIHHFPQFSSLLFEQPASATAKFLELVGSSVCIRQALASANIYLCQEINPISCKGKEDKEASCSIEIVGCSSSTMKS